MKDIEKIESTVQPFYNQLEQLGTLYKCNFLSWGFLRAARKLFGKQYFYELRLIFKAENRAAKHAFRLAKYEDKKQFKQDWRALRRYYRNLKRTSVSLDDCPNDSVESTEFAVSNVSEQADEKESSNPE